MSRQALLLTDVQHDFCPSGVLAVPHGDDVALPWNRYVDLFAQAHLPIYASRDSHPRIGAFR